MKLIEVGWNLPEGGGEKNYLVKMTDAQFRELEGILKAAYHAGTVTDYWLSDTIIFPFKVFMDKVINK